MKNSTTKKRKTHEGTKELLSMKAEDVFFQSIGLGSLGWFIIILFILMWKTFIVT